MTPASSARCWYKGMPFSAAAASATAMETPRMALAPSLPLLGVPSSLIRKSSMSFWLVTARPDFTSSGAMMSLTFATALETPDKIWISQSGPIVSWTSARLFRRNSPYRHRAARLLREHQWMRQKEQQRGNDLCEDRNNSLNIRLPTIDPILSGPTLRGVQVDLDGWVTAGVENLLHHQNKADAVAIGPYSPGERGLWLRT